MESNWIGSYILNEAGEAIPADTLTWGKWYETANRRVALTDLGAAGRVSTVFLGLDHNFGLDRSPVLWETMIFGGPLTQEQRRYSSAEEAVRGHAEMVERCRQAITEATFGKQK